MSVDTVTIRRPPDDTAGRDRRGGAGGPAEDADETV